MVPKHLTCMSRHILLLIFIKVLFPVSIAIIISNFVSNEMASLLIGVACLNLFNQLAEFYSNNLIYYKYFYMKHQSDMFVK